MVDWIFVQIVLIIFDIEVDRWHFFSIYNSSQNIFSDMPTNSLILIPCRRIHGHVQRQHVHVLASISCFTTYQWRSPSTKISPLRIVFLFFILAELLIHVKVERIRGPSFRPSPGRNETFHSTKTKIPRREEFRMWSWYGFHERIRRRRGESARGG